MSSLSKAFPKDAKKFEKDMHGGFNEDPDTVFSMRVCIAVCRDRDRGESFGFVCLFDCSCDCSTSADTLIDFSCLPVQYTFNQQYAVLLTQSM